MDVREATIEDAPKIIELLKLSLGEKIIPKSERLWLWKHYANPFGQSYVKLAFNNNKLVGVRAFMRWQWIQNNVIINSTRAVDTATHPDYQGRGIFSILTSQLVKDRKEAGDAFIFNTPNDKSKPGYIKLGWNEVGRLPVKLSIRLQRKQPTEFRLIDNWDELLSSNNIDAVLKIIDSSSILGTNYSKEYLKWRYALNPEVNYGVLASIDPIPFLLVYRWKDTKSIKELRLVDCFGRADIGLSYLVRKRRLSFITVSGFCNSLTPTEYFFNFNIGPSVTVRNLNSSETINFNNWNPTLGDLEFF